MRTGFHSIVPMIRLGVASFMGVVVLLDLQESLIYRNRLVLGYSHTERGEPWGCKSQRHHRIIILGSGSFLRAIVFFVRVMGVVSRASPWERYGQVHRMPTRMGLVSHQQTSGNLLFRNCLVWREERHHPRARTRSYKGTRSKDENTTKRLIVLHHAITMCILPRAGRASRSLRKQ